MTVLVILVVVAAIVAGVALSSARSARTRSAVLAGLLDAERSLRKDDERIYAESLEKKLAEIDARSETVEALRENLKNLEDLHRNACAQITAIADERNLQRRRADEFFAMIDGVVKEKDGIWDLYRRSSQQAGAAQTWLFRELDRLYRLVNEYRRARSEPPIQPPKELVGLVREFTESAAAIPERAPGGAEPPPAA